MMADDPLLKQPPRLLAMFQNRSPEMDIEDVQHRTANLNVRAQTAAPFPAGSGDVEIAVDVDRESAEHDISVTSSLQPTSFPEGEVKTELLDDESELVLFAFRPLDAE